jgi:hypothetical protein
MNIDVGPAKFPQFPWPDAGVRDDHHHVVKIAKGRVLCREVKDAANLFLSEASPAVFTDGRRVAF